MGTADLDVLYVSASQNQKEVTINAGFDALDAALAAELSVDAVAHASPYTIPYDASAGGVKTALRFVKLTVTGAIGADWTGIMPASRKKIFMAENATSGGWSVKLKTLGHSGITIGPGDTAFCYLDGTDVTSLHVASAGGNIATDGDVDLGGLTDLDRFVWDNAASKWRNQRAPYPLAISFLDILANSQDLLYHPFPRAVTFPANFGSYLGGTSKATGSAVATASTTITVSKALAASPLVFSTVGTIVFATGTVTPTFATTGGVAINFAAGDIMRLRGPASADATFAGFAAALIGFET